MTNCENIIADSAENCDMALPSDSEEWRNSSPDFIYCKDSELDSRMFTSVSCSSDYSVDEFKYACTNNWCYWDDSTNACSSTACVEGISSPYGYHYEPAMFCQDSYQWSEESKCETMGCSLAGDEEID